MAMDALATLYTWIRDLFPTGHVPQVNVVSTDTAVIVVGEHGNHGNTYDNRTGTGDRHG